MGTLLRLYQRALGRHPIVWQSIQTGILMGTGDVISQTLVEKKPLSHYHYQRTVEFFCIGTFLVGPTVTCWYRILEKIFHRPGTEVDKAMVLKKVACDQLIFAPAFLWVFLNAVGLLQGQTIQQTKHLVEKNYTDILIANYKLWPFVQVVNFYAVPLNYQVLVVQCIAVSWNTYLAYKTKPEDDD